MWLPVLTSAPWEISNSTMGREAEAAAQERGVAEVYPLNARLAEAPCVRNQVTRGRLFRVIAELVWRRMLACFFFFFAFESM
jgi:hypothetical protein